MPDVTFGAVSLHLRALTAAGAVNVRTAGPRRSHHANRGALVIRSPGAGEARGEIIEIIAPERLTLTYGYTTGTPISPGASLVAIRLETAGADTRLHLTHAFTDAAVRDEHVQGWRYQLSLLANAVS